MASGPIPRARPPPPDKRESVLRASIFDTALELGIGTSSTVANWIFNPVNEAEEDLESTLSPSLTYASTATSEDSSPSTSHASRLARSGADSPLGSNAKPSMDSAIQYMQREGRPGPVAIIVPEPPSQRKIQFDLSTTPEPRVPSPLPPAATKPKKLRKAKPDGYESDGGYVSDGTKSEKEKRRWRKEKKDKEKPRARGSDDESEGGYLSDILNKRRNKKKEKLKTVDLPATDYETDGGYMSASSINRKKKDKKSKSPFASPALGEESDGGNMSESSTKKRRFFRLNTRSRKREDSDAAAAREIVPPVPALPPILPIAERFARSETPSVTDSRAMSPAFTEQTVTQRSSDDASFMDTMSSISIPLDSPRGLTKAFRDAESIRTPSTDVLRAFGRQVGLSALRSPTKESYARDDSDATQTSSSLSPLQNAPALNMPKPKRNLSQKRTPAQISAPNTQALSARPHPPPMTLTPPSPSSGISPLRLSPRSLNTDTGSMVIVAQPGTPMSSIYDTVPHSPSTTADFIGQSPLPSPGLPTGSSIPLGSAASRAHLAKYDLPPPSPPPVGPLPRPPSNSISSLDLTGVPRSLRMSTSRPGTGDSDRVLIPSPLSRSNTSSPVHPDSAPVRMPPSPFRPTLKSATAASASPTSAPAVMRSAFGPATPASATAPLFLRRVPSVQRGRESPFPQHPVFPRSDSSNNVSKVARQPPEIRVSTDRDSDIDAGGSDGYHGDNVQHSLDATLYTRRSRELADDDCEARSWVDFGGSHDSSRRSSMESHPDIDSVLSVLQESSDIATDEAEDYIGLYTERSTAEYENDEDDDDRSRYPDDNLSVTGRSTRYFDADSEEGGDRYSIWSEADRRSRASILDGERSSESREKLMRRVAAMYSREGIAKGLVPPVPAVPMGIGTTQKRG